MSEHEVDARIEVVVGDITRLNVDAIVNAANSFLNAGGGVCGAIHRAAGPELLEECDRIGGCPTGQARITRGYRLPAPWVIHAVGPVWKGGVAKEDSLLAAAYLNSLSLTEQHNLRSIAFPAISTGIYNFPLERATAIAVRTVRRYLAEHPALERVVFVCFDPLTEAAYHLALGRTRQL